MREFYHPELWVEGPSMVEAIFNRFGNEVRIVLNNGIHSKTIAGDMWAGEDSKRGHTTLAEVVPVHNLAVKVRGRAVAEAFDLKGRPLNVRRTGGVATISVPVLEQYEVVRFRPA
jgi:hypothetical protein